MGWDSSHLPAQFFDDSADDHFGIRDLQRYHSSWSDAYARIQPCYQLIVRLWWQGPNLSRDGTLEFVQMQHINDTSVRNDWA